MAKDSWSATTGSTIIVAADEHRDALLIQKTNATVVALGIGEAAVAGKGVQLLSVGDAITIRGTLARHAVYAIGNGGAGTYQDGDILFQPGTYAAQ